MKNKHALFRNVGEIKTRIAEYFEWIQGVYHTEVLPFKPTAKAPPEMREQRVWDREPQPATLTGLAHYLGFDSREAFEAYEIDGAFKKTLKRARLKIESEYEKLLLSQPSTGAIFALKCLGWTDRATGSKTVEPPATDTTLKIEIISTGPSPAGSEQQVAL
ncbi:DNA-packaging protein [Mucilaginibacter daejeonensis]|uniref:DNA-packaging protein n=1 Tax=Mucilaginibacter daejeonensis TaxID=398049 RepID=UPI001D17AA6F|nr:DNA-packaging protein [Mucilaginibacter daejeonensis]UEG54549.1 DNA-packaging protein [Mucilaginibacter daejeonensis]